MIVWYSCKEMVKSHAGETKQVRSTKPKTQGLGIPHINEKMINSSVWCINKTTAV